MRGSGTRDNSTRPDSGNKEVLAISGAFNYASAPPPAENRHKGRRRHRRNKRERFFSLRLTFEEYAALQKAAGDVALGVYIRSKLFNEPLPEHAPRRPRQPVKDQQVLGQLLGELGKARLANNLNQLAKAANTGSLPVGPETEKALRDACSEIAQMRKALMQGLGMPVEEAPR